jgi:hypothetical protein
VCGGGGTLLFLYLSMLCVSSAQCCQWYDTGVVGGVCALEHCCAVLF